MPKHDIVVKEIILFDDDSIKTRRKNGKVAVAREIMFVRKNLFLQKGIIENNFSFFFFHLENKSLW